jgi:hypothetical protein
MNASAQVGTGTPGLAQILFGQGDTPVFAVLDGASAPDLLKNLYEHEPEYCCLYRGELQPDIATVAPYLVRLESGAEFAELVLREGWGVHWGVFVVSVADLRTLRNHFREFLHVELPDRNTVLLRYYDPRVLRTFLPACNEAELAAFFGPVQSFIVEGDTPETGVTYALAGKALKPVPFQLKKSS